MVMVRLKGIKKVTSKGKTYWYAWPGGPRLRGEPGSKEFIESYQEAANPLANADRSKLDGWVSLYRNSDEFRELADSTKYRWTPWLDRIRDYFGAYSVRLFDRPEIVEDIREWRDQWRGSPRTADYAKQVLSRVLSHAMSRGKLRSNPCAVIENLYKADRSEIIWTPADLAQLLRTASVEVGHAAQLAALTGLRYGDLFRLAWGHIGDLAIEMPTSKGKRYRRRVVIPLYSQLRELLAAIPKRATTVLTNSDGLPWRGFSSSWNAALEKAGLADANLHFHDLRGTAATNLYRADLSIREIAQIMGWEEDRVERLIDRYVKRDEILRDRIRRMERAQEQ